MRHSILATAVVAMFVFAATTAHAIPPNGATTNIIAAYEIAHGEQQDESLWYYEWEVTFRGLDEAVYGDNQRMRAFALYGLPKAVDVYTKDLTIHTYENDVKTVRKDPATWASFDRTDGGQDDPPPIESHAWWQAQPANSGNLVHPGESIAHFVTVFKAPLPDDYLNPEYQIPSGIHVLYDEGSIWVNHYVPEPVSALLLALGLPAVLVARRRKREE